MLIIKTTTTTTNYLRTIFILVSLMISTLAFSQEICNNGIDDDSDGLVDLNDTANCNCSPATTSVPSLIPNPSFETMACCPSSYSQVNCAQGWVQATSATSDYMNTCGMVFGAATGAGLVPFPDGAGIVGCIFSPGWQEYVGTCLTAPMVAGTSYSVQMNIASTPIDGFGNVCNGGVIDFGAIDIVIFGAPSCGSLPAPTTGCPTAPWVVLGQTTYTPNPAWGTITITFTPSITINTIMIGSPCALPASYSPPSGCYPYFYFDNMLLNTTASFTSTISQTGTWCSNNIQITGNSVSGATYQWYLNGVAIVGQTGLVLNVSALGLPAGDYTFVTTVGATCSEATSTVVATGSTTPIITAAGPFCVNSAPVNLVADISGGTWSGSGITNTTLGTFDPSAATIGNNTITYTTAGSCPGVGTATIVVNALPTINAGPDQTICIGGSAALAGSFGGSATSGTWTGGAGTYSTSNTDPLATYTPSAAEETAGTVTLTFTSDDPAGPCASVNDQVIITISALPGASAGLDQTICDGSSAPLSGAISGAATTATWTGGAGTFSPNNTTLNAVYTPTAAEAAAGTVTLTITTNDPAGPCTFAVDQMTITINPVATVSAGPDQTICIATTATLAGVFGGSATSGTWSGGAGTYSPSASTANAVYTPTAAEEAAGTVTLTFTSDDPVGPCSSVTDQMTITITQLPTANAGTSQSVCSGNSITLAGSIGGSATTGTWSGGAGTYAPNASTLNAVYTPTAAEYAAGSITLTLTTDDPAGPCTFSTSTVTFTFYQNPVVSFNGNNLAGCPVHCVNFTDLTTVGGGDVIVGWSWNFGEGGLLGTTQNPSNCYEITGLYNVSLTATSNNGCSTTLTMPSYIQVYPKPVADFIPTPNPATILEPAVTLNNASSSDVTSWWYYFGDGDSINPNVPSPVHIYPNVFANTYLATLIVENNYGCLDTVDHLVEIAPEFTFFIPNAFTPNGDGTNDFFFGQGIGIVEYDLLVFDRWGNLIFHGDDINKMWDGKVKGGSEIAQQDVYVWKVKLKDIFQKKHNYIGTVTLVK